MTTRERAYDIFSRLSEEQLEGFISLFGIYYKPIDDNNDDVKKRAYSELKSMILSIPDLDEKKELSEYREERYGI